MSNYCTLCKYSHLDVDYYGCDNCFESLCEPCILEMNTRYGGDNDEDCISCAKCDNCAYGVLDKREKDKIDRKFHDLIQIEYELTHQMKLLRKNLDKDKK
jgi:hypothetical protein